MGPRRRLGSAWAPCSLGGASRCCASQGRLAKARTTPHVASELWQGQKAAFPLSLKFQRRRRDSTATRVSQVERQLCLQSTSLPDDAVPGVVAEMHAVWRETEALDHPPSDVAPPLAVAPKTTPGRQDVAGNEPTQKAKRPRVASPDRSASRACVASTGAELKGGAASTGGRAHKYPIGASRLTASFFIPLGSCSMAVYGLFC